MKTVDKIQELAYRFDITEFRKLMISGKLNANEKEMLNLFFYEHIKENDSKDDVSFLEPHHEYVFVIASILNSLETRESKFEFVFQLIKATYDPKFKERKGFLEELLKYLTTSFGATFEEVRLGIGDNILESMKFDVLFYLVDDSFRNLDLIVKECRRILKEGLIHTNERFFFKIGLNNNVMVGTDLFLNNIVYLDKQLLELSKEYHFEFIIDISFYESLYTSKVMYYKETYEHPYFSITFEDSQKVLSNLTVLQNMENVSLIKHGVIEPNNELKLLDTLALHLSPKWFDKLLREKEDTSFVEFFKKFIRNKGEQETPYFNKYIPFDWMGTKGFLNDRTGVYHKFRDTTELLYLLKNLNQDLKNYKESFGVYPHNQEFSTLTYSKKIEYILSRKEKSLEDLMVAKKSTLKETSKPTTKKQLFKKDSLISEILLETKVWISIFLPKPFKKRS